MGDVVLANFVSETPKAAERMAAALAADAPVDVYVIIADATRRAEGLQTVQAFARGGLEGRFLPRRAKVGKQFQAAEGLGAKFAVVVGGEWPEVKVKTLATRQEVQVPQSGLADWLKSGENSL